MKISEKTAIRTLDFVIMAWVFVIFHFLGNKTDVTFFGRSIFSWMIYRWGDSTFSAGDYSHGWLIPIVSVYALWFNRDRLRSATRHTWWPAACIVCLALILHLAGLRAQLPRISLTSLMILLWSIPAFMYGKHLARQIYFPAFYLIFCIPLNFLDSIAFPLRMLATNLSTFLLNGIGIPAAAQGTAIMSPGGAFMLEVADPCSGIKSLLALTAITVAFAFFFQDKMWKRIVLVIMSAPLAVAGNIARIIALATFATWFGQEKAFSFYHDYSGYIVFLVAVLLMLAIDKGVNRLDEVLARKRAGTRRSPGPTHSS